MTNQILARVLLITFSLFSNGAYALSDHATNVPSRPSLYGYCVGTDIYDSRFNQVIIRSVDPLRDTLRFSLNPRGEGAQRAELEDRIENFFYPRGCLGNSKICSEDHVNFKGDRAEVVAVNAFEDSLMLKDLASQRLYSAPATDVTLVETSKKYSNERRSRSYKPSKADQKPLPYCPRQIPYLASGVIYVKPKVTKLPDGTWYVQTNENEMTRVYLNENDELVEGPNPLEPNKKMAPNARVISIGPNTILSPEKLPANIKPGTTLYNIHKIEQRKKNPQSLVAGITG